MICGFCFILLSFLTQACIPSFDNLPPPVIHTECLSGGSSPCHPGYRCGPYGCARRPKMHGVRTNTMNRGAFSKLAQRPKKRETTVDEFMFECCIDHQLPDGCLQKCSFSKYSKEAILTMVLRQGNCVLEALPVLHYCASRSKDHTLCCSRAGVPPHCQLFCGPPFDHAKVEQHHLICMEHLEKMKACFYSDIQGLLNPKQDKTTWLKSEYKK